MYGCESWNTKKAKRQRIDAFEPWCWRKFLRVPWTARRSNQSILKEISPEYSLEGLMLKLKLQYFGHLMEELTHWKRPWCWEKLKAGGEGDDRGWKGWMTSLTQWTWIWASSGSWWCYPIISSSIVPFSSHFLSFPASGSFQMSQFFASGAQSIGVSASTSVLPKSTQDWSLEMYQL